MEDSYKDEYLPRLQRSLIYQELEKKCIEKDPEVIALVNNVVSYTMQRTKTIIKHMGEFTLHDGDHLFKVLLLMDRLLTSQNVKNLSSPELMLLILSSFLHDIGMSPDEKDVITWKKIWDFEPELDESENMSFYKFKRFYSARPEQQEIINQLISQGKYSEAEIMKSYIVTEYIRQTHAERAREIIDLEWKDKIIFRDTNLSVELAQICYSHDDDALSVLDLDKNLLCGTDIYACLPLVGVILRLADILDFDAKRTPQILYSHLYVRHPISIKEWNKHRAVEAWEIKSDLIQFSAKCKHPAIEASIHEFSDLIDKELSVCNNIVYQLNEFNKSKGRDISVKFPFKVNRDKILTEKDIYNNPKYKYRNTQFTLSKKQVVDLLMGTKLYGSSEVALRELLQNSIDACLLRQAQEKKWGNIYDPKITVKYYSEDKDMILEVEDNGTGMDQDIIDNYYSKVGSSFYKSTEFYNLKSETNAFFIPTSRFGIGILSCFMVSDTLIVDTKRVYAQHKSSDALNITVEGQESIFWIKEGKREMPGTSTKLILRKKINPWGDMDDSKFIKFVENLVPNPPFKINIQASLRNKVIDENSFKEITPSSLEDYSWELNDYIKTFELNIDGYEDGILGSAKIAVLESHGKPVKSIKKKGKDVKIEEEIFTLEKEITIDVNSIKESSKSITINDQGDIKEDRISRVFARSKSRLSLHGIEVPTTLFPESWRMKNNQVKLAWPISLILVVDICGKRDLDLNSSRTEIIMSEKWMEFEEQLAFLVLSRLSKSVSIEYWNELKVLFMETSENEVFLRALERI